MNFPPVSQHQRFEGLDLTSVALLFDIDGTLIDLGPAPEAVCVPDELRHSLARLHELTDGALALVSGRLIESIDRLFAPLRLPVVGGHGAQMRLGQAMPQAGIMPLPKALRDRLATAVDLDPGIIVEDKGYSVALHYRNAPAQEQRLHQLVTASCAAFSSEAIEVLPGKAMLEVKRTNVSKGAAVRKLMTFPPFKGRRPVFLGDDITDESVFAVLPDLGGIGFSVGMAFDGLAGEFESPQDVRDALGRLAAKGEDVRA